MRAIAREASQIPFSKEIEFSNSNVRPSVRRTVAWRPEPGIQIKARPHARAARRTAKAHKPGVSSSNYPDLRTECGGKRHGLREAFGRPSLAQSDRCSWARSLADEALPGAAAVEATVAASASTLSTNAGSESISAGSVYSRSSLRLLYQ